MKIGEIRALCEPELGQERNRKICEQIGKIDERMIYHVDRNILNLSREKNPLQNIDEILSTQAWNGKGAAESPFYNTWPFGVDTDEIFPRFLAVCRGRQKLGGVLNIVLRQSRQMVDRFGNDVDTLKNVVVLTDKWDVADFKKYEKELLHYALHCGVWYTFLLVTEYGYTQIPFLPNNRNVLRTLRDENIEDDVTLEDMLMRLGGRAVEYRSTGGPWQQLEAVEYTFDFADLCPWWEKWSRKEGEREGRISKAARDRFLKSTSWIADMERNTLSAISGSDFPTHTLRIYGKTIEWDYVDDDKRLRDLEKEVNRLIKDCECER